MSQIAMASHGNFLPEICICRMQSSPLDRKDEDSDRGDRRWRLRQEHQLDFSKFVKALSEKRLFRRGGASGFFIVGVSVFHAMEWHRMQSAMSKRQGDLAEGPSSSLQITHNNILCRNESKPQDGNVILPEMSHLRRNESFNQKWVKNHPMEVTHHFQYAHYTKTHHIGCSPS